MEKQQEIERIKKQIDDLSEIYCEIWSQRELYEERGYLEAYHEAQSSLFALSERIDELEAYLKELTGTAKNS